MKGSSSKSDNNHNHIALNLFPCTQHCKMKAKCLRVKKGQNLQRSMGLTVKFEILTWK